LTVSVIVSHNVTFTYLTTGKRQLVNTLHVTTNYARHSCWRTLLWLVSFIM